MNEAETAARGQRANAANDEFITPAVAEYRTLILEKIADVARNELDSRKRADKLSGLSHALRTVEMMEGFVRAAIKDGEYAASKLIQVEKIERMPVAKRRLLDIAPRY